MSRIILAIFTMPAIVASATILFAEPPPDDMVQKLRETIQKHCSEAKIEVTKDEFIAKSGTMMFTFHRRSKSGDISPQTYQQEGPNFKGFILRVALHDGKYEGAAAVPQTLQGPYFPTFIDAPTVEKSNKHYQVHFSYGSRLDADLKKAIVEMIPKTHFQPGAAPDHADKEVAAKGASSPTTANGHVSDAIWMHYRGDIVETAALVAQYVRHWEKNGKWPKAGTYNTKVLIYKGTEPGNAAFPNRRRDFYRTLFDGGRELDVILHDDGRIDIDVLWDREPDAPGR